MLASTLKCSLNDKAIVLKILCVKFCAWVVKKGQNEMLPGSPLKQCVSLFNKINLIKIWHGSFIRLSTFDSYQLSVNWKTIATIEALSNQAQKSSHMIF